MQTHLVVPELASVVIEDEERPGKTRLLQHPTEIACQAAIVKPRCVNRDCDHPALSLPTQA